LKKKKEVAGGGPGFSAGGRVQSSFLLRISSPFFKNIFPQLFRRLPNIIFQNPGKRCGDDVDENRTLEGIAKTLRRGSTRLRLRLRPSGLHRAIGKRTSEPPMS
jgi:hypothetical protein